MGWQRGVVFSEHRFNVSNKRAGHIQAGQEPKKLAYIYATGCELVKSILNTYQNTKPKNPKI